MTYEQQVAYRMSPKPINELPRHVDQVEARERRREFNYDLGNDLLRMSKK